MTGPCLRSLQLLIALALTGCAAHGGPRPLAEPPSAPLAPLVAERGQRDCAPEGVLTRLCRVPRTASAAVLEARLAAGTPVWREGDALTFAYRGEADSVGMGGGIQLPLTRLPGTDLWTLTVRIPRLDELALSYFFYPSPLPAPSPGRFQPLYWRGPLAPPLPDTSTTLQGRMVVDTIHSRHLGEGREVRVYLPPTRGSAPYAAVVYIADGAASGLASTLDTLVAAGALPRIMLVSIQNAGSDHGRNAEYLLTAADGDERFIAHERFLLDEVMPWVEDRFGAPTDARSRAVFGFSNGGAFAMDMGLRHPEVFGRVLAFSPAGRRAGLLPGTSVDSATAFYLLGGTLEPAFHQKALDWSAVLTRAGIENVLREPVAGHDWAMWQAWFPDALAWAFGRDGSARSAAW